MSEEKQDSAASETTAQIYARRKQERAHATPIETPAASPPSGPIAQVYATRKAGRVTKVFTR